jgi:NADH-quinone oxidoreductase subunit B
MAAVDLPLPHAGARPGVGLGPGVIAVDVGGAYSLRVFDAGLACCGVEVAAALRRSTALAAAGEGIAGEGIAGEGIAGEGIGGEGPAGAGAAENGTAGEGRGCAAPLNVFVVAGTVTDKLAPFVLRAFQDTPQPRRVLSFGACANSGGPYWDSYCVTKGVDQFIPVDVYVPGCPPRPEALLEGLALVLGSPGEPV